MWLRLVLYRKVEPRCIFFTLRCRMFLQIVLVSQAFTDSILFVSHVREFV